MTSIYQAAQSHAVWFDHTSRGRLLLTERDRLDLMNRLSTNRLVDLPEGHARATLFLNANARILYHTLVLNRGETVMVITEAEQGAGFEAFLRRNIFWNDKLDIKSVTDSLHHIGIYGPQSAEVVAQWWPDAAMLDHYQFAMDVGAWLVRVDDIADAPAYWVMGPPDFMTEVHAHLNTLQIPQAAAEDYDLLRIEAGLPAVGHELTDAYIPLELGLWNAVSFNKGCYTGQEIIARMESRGKLARMLVQIESDTPLNVGDSLQNQAGKTTGTITSTAVHPESGKVHGLAVVKSADATAQTILQTLNAVPVHVVSTVGNYDAQYD
jgi:tRNA-modifying protein YgfZ